MPATRLLDQVRVTARLRHLSLKTEKAYVHQIKRYILFHGKKHPAEMDEGHIRAYLSYLAVERNVAASTQNAALAALLFSLPRRSQTKTGSHRGRGTRQNYKTHARCPVAA